MAKIFLLILLVFPSQILLLSGCSKKRSTPQHTSQQKTAPDKAKGNSSNDTTPAATKDFESQSTKDKASSNTPTTTPVMATIAKATPSMSVKQDQPLAENAMLDSPIQYEFKRGFQKIQNEVQFQQEKQNILKLQKELHAKQEELRRDIYDSKTVMNARLIEFAYLANFLDVDHSAHNAVKYAFRSSLPSHMLKNVETISALVAGPSLAIYYFPTLGKGASELIPSKIKPEPSSRIYKIAESTYNYAKKPELHKAAGVIALAGGAVYVGALSADYYLSNPENISANVEARKYLSQLVTDNQNSYLTMSQIDKALTLKAKDSAFGNAILSEVDQILTHLNHENESIHENLISLKKLDQRSQHLEQELQQAKSELNLPVVVD